MKTSGATPTSTMTTFDGLDDRSSCSDLDNFDFDDADHCNIC